MAQATVAASYVTGLLGYAASRGGRREALMSRAGLCAEELGSPERRVPLEKYLLLMRAAKEACDDPALALHFGESIDLREMSITALLGQSCETAMDALEAFNRYGRLDADVETDGPDRLRLVRKAGKLWLVDARANAAAAPEMTESGFARMVAAGRRVGMEMPLRQVHFTHAEPPYRQEYERIFRVPLTFDSDWNALQIDESTLSQRIALQPAYAGRILAERADALLAGLDRQASLGDALEAALKPLLAGGARIDAAACAVGLSRATLYRLLKAEGVTFEQVRDRLRQRLAREFLADRRLSVPEIAHRLGFADRASFSKTFKRWTGSTPGAVRRAVGQG